MNTYIVSVALCIVLLVCTCHISTGQHTAKRSPPVAPGKQQQQHQQAPAWPLSSTKPLAKLTTPTKLRTQSPSSITVHQEQTQLYECVMCSKPAAGVVRAAAASASAQQTAVAALQAAGIQVNGRFGIQASLRMTPSQAASRAVQDNCCYITRSTPTHG